MELFGVKYEGTFKELSEKYQDYLTAEANRQEELDKIAKRKASIQRREISLTDKLDQGYYKPSEKCATVGYSVLGFIGGNILSFFFQALGCVGQLLAQQLDASHHLQYLDYLNVPVVRAWNVKKFALSQKRII